MRKKLGKFVLPVLAVAMLAFAVIHVVKAQQTAPKPEPPVEPPRTPFGNTVAGAGIAEAKTENIAIGSPLPGVVLEVFVPVEAVGKHVKEGEPLFRVDDRQLKAQLRLNEAQLKAAQAQLAKLEAQPRPEEVPPAEAQVAVAEATERQQRDIHARDQKIQFGAMAEEDRVVHEQTWRLARAQLTYAQANLALLKAGAWKPDIDIARAAVEQARAQLEITRTDLERTVVCAPVEGDVLQVNVRPGEFVGAPPSQALVVLGNVHQLHVRVDIDEHDIPRFRKGAPAFANPRGNPQLKYPLTFVRVEPYVIPKKSLTGDNTERVDTRVLQVIYALDVSDKPIYVGQQLDVFIDVGKDKTAGPPPANGAVASRKP
jgi:multidrug resistance efflux pump